MGKMREDTSEYVAVILVGLLFGLLFMFLKFDGPYFIRKLTTNIEWGHFEVSESMGTSAVTS